MWPTVVNKTNPEHGDAMETRGTGCQHLHQTSHRKDCLCHFAFLPFPYTNPTCRPVFLAFLFLLYCAGRPLDYLNVITQWSPTEHQASIFLTGLRHWTSTPTWSTTALSLAIFSVIKQRGEGCKAFSAPLRTPRHPSRPQSPRAGVRNLTYG